MQKKIWRIALCIGTLCVALIVGCSRTKPQRTEETLNAVEKNWVEDVDDMAEDLVLEVERNQDILVAQLTAKLERKSAIQDETDASELLGTWSVTFDNAKVIEDEWDDAYPGFHGEFDLTIYLTFYDDNTFAMYVAEAEVEPAMQSYLESLAQYCEDYAYDMLAETGLSKEEIDSFLEEECGMPFYDYMLQEFVSVITVEEFVEGIYVSGVYEVRGNELHMDEHFYDFDIYTVEDNILTLTLPEGAEVEPTGIDGFDYPYVFTRVK